MIFVKKGDTPDRGEFELWVSKPKFIGKFAKTGTRRIETHDGLEFATFHAAARFLLERAGEKEVIAKLDAEEATPPKPRHRVDGIDIVTQGKWAAFCKMRRIDPKDVSAIQQTHELDEVEYKILGLKHIA